MINKFLLLIFLVMIISPVSAEEFNFKQSSSSDIIFKCINNGVCSSSTVCNLTVSDPDNIILMDNAQMTRSSNGGYYNYTLNSTQTSKLGEYKVGGFCKDGSVTRDLDFSFFVSINGLKLKTSESFIYLGGLLASSILFFLSLFFAIKLPWKNRVVNEKIVGISKVKYLKLGLILLCYGLLNWNLNLLLGLSSFLSLNIFYGFFEFLFMIMVRSSLIVFIIWAIFFIYTMKNDSKLYKMIKRGVFENA